MSGYLTYNKDSPLPDQQIYDSFNSIDTESQHFDILMEDWIEKKSRYLGSWRLRYAVLKRYNFCFVLCTFKQNFNITSYASYECAADRDDLVKPTEVLLIDYSTIITTHDGGFKQYKVDRFNLYINASNERCQLRIHPTKSKYTGTDWMRAISKAKLISQQLLHQMIPYYILAYCSRTYLQRNTFPFEVTQIIVNYINQSYDVEDISIDIWKWNRYHSLFQQSLFDQVADATPNRRHTVPVVSGSDCEGHAKSTPHTDGICCYLLCDQTICKGNNDAFVDHTMFSIGNSSSSDRCASSLSTSRILNNPWDLRLNLERNCCQHLHDYTKVIYHELPAIADHTELSLPSVVYRNNHLFVVGGCYKDERREHRVMNRMYAMNLNLLHWQWTQIDSETVSETNLTASGMLAKYGVSLLFLNDTKLLMVGGWNRVTKCVDDALTEVVLITFNQHEYEDGFDVVKLNDSHIGHTFGGMCRGIGGNANVIGVASRRYLELYDLHKNEWMLYGWKTRAVHCRPRVWMDKKDANLVYVAGNGADRIEWIDVREQRQWRAFKYTDCVCDVIDTQPQMFLNQYNPSIVII